MEYKSNAQEKPTDVVFLGHMNRNRYQHLFPFIQDKSLNTLIKTDGYIRSKIGLNIHVYEGKPLVANKVLVMTETSNDSWYNQHRTDLVYYFKTTNYYDEYLEYIQNYDYQTADKIYEFIRTNYAYIYYITDIVYIILPLMSK